MKLTQVITTFVLASPASALANPLQQSRHGVSMVYDFDTVEATVDLDWVPCFDIFNCTKLVVPLDYEDPSAGTTYVSFMKWTSNSTAPNATTQDILVNPGGPGDSGIKMLLGGLPLLLASLGMQNNIVGFDPRGVNNSGPNLSCFPGGERGTYRLYDKSLATPLNTNDRRSYGRAFARAAAFGDFCTNAHSAINDTAKYANTVATANDMRFYTELLAKSKGEDAQTAQLWYYGISYGSVLGTTFAALFPNRVGRIAVDGVVDGEDYYEGSWSSNIADGDDAFRYFFKSCYDAGKDMCSFWASSPDAIEARFHAIATSLEEMPIAVTMETPVILTNKHLKMVTTDAVYAPLESFAEFADMLVELEKGNATYIADHLRLGLKLKEDCPSVSPKSLDDAEPRQFIACTDANGRANLTYEAFVSRANNLIKTSKYLGEAWAAGTSISCRKLDIRAPKSQVFEGYPSAPKTSNPLFFLSALIDPVTPLRSAQKMAERFGGAKLLIQDSVGHTTIASVSQCTYGHLKNYFYDGSLPEDGTHCDVDRFPFLDEPVTGPLSWMQKRGF